jgi:hypothetical protein
MIEETLDLLMEYGLPPELALVIVYRFGGLAEHPLAIAYRTAPGVTLHRQHVPPHPRVPTCGCGASREAHRIEHTWLGYGRITFSLQTADGFRLCRHVDYRPRPQARRALHI